MDNNIKKVFIVFKTHFDIGYTHLARELVEWYATDMMKDVIEVCKVTSNNPKGKKYVWTVPSWPLKVTVDGIRDTELKQMVEKLIEERQLIWHGLPFTTHTEFCGMEEFIRGLYVAGELSVKYGHWTSDAKMTDVPGHTWILPSILSKAGIKFLHLGSNFCASPPDVPKLFYWEGPDGSKVLTYYSKGDYGTDLIPPDDWNYPYWLAMLQTLDNLGAQDSKYLDKLFERAKIELPGTEVSIGSLEDFGNAIIDGGFDIPVIKGDLADTWIRGVGSAPFGVSKVRTQRSLLSTLESVTALKKLNGLYENDEDQINDRNTIAQAYEKMLLFGEHTWSIDTKVTILPERYYGAPWIGFKFWESGIYDRELFNELKCSDAGYLKLQESWQEQLDYLRDTEKGIKDISNDTLNKLAASVDIQGERLVVASNLGWKTRLQIILEDALAPDISVKYLEDCENDEKLIIYLNHDGKRCVDLNTPALGYKTLRIIRGKESGINSEEIQEIASVCGSKGILENSLLRIEIDNSTGCITSLYNKPFSKECVNNNSEQGFGQYIYDVYGSDELKKYLCDYSYVLRDWGVNDYGKAGYPKGQKHERYVSGNFQLQAENGYNWGKITAFTHINDRSTTVYGNAIKLKISISLYRDKDYLDIRYDLFDKQETPIIESGHFAFPLALNNPQYRINKMGCVIDPENDIVSGCNKDIHCLEKWVDINDGNCGMAIISYDMPLFSFVEPGVLKYDKDFKIKEPTILMQAFNNGWGTNFPQWIGGNLTYRYRIIPHQGDWQEVELFKKAEETLAFPVVSYAESGNGCTGIPLSTELFAKDLDGFTVLCFKMAENQDAYILRLIENRGTERKTDICLSISVNKVCKCDLVERKQEQIEVRNDNRNSIFAIDTKSFEIHSFIIFIGKMKCEFAVDNKQL